MPKRKSITFVFTVAIAIVALFATTQNLAQGASDPPDECTILAQLNKRTTLEYTITPELNANGQFPFLCGDDPRCAGFSQDAILAPFTISGQQHNKVNLITMAFPAMPGVWLDVIKVGPNANSWEDFPPGDPNGPYPYDYTKSSVKWTFSSTGENERKWYVIFDKLPPTTPPGFSIGSDWGNITVGTGSDDFPCNPGIITAGIIEVCQEPPPVIANTQDVVKIKDSNGTVHTGEVYFDEDGNILQVKRNGTDITDEAQPMSNVLIRFLIGGEYVPSAAGEPLEDVQPRSLSRSGPNDTCAYWYRGVYYDFCP